MGTPYQDIYDLHSGMYSDYEFLQLIIPEQDEILEGWLLNTIGWFDNCKISLSDRNEEQKQFNQTLSDKEKRVLAKGMIVEWLNPKLYNIENLKNYMSTKDFNQFSPANLLKEIRSTHDKAEQMANREKNAYAHKNFNPLIDLVQR
jgi:hypothetical protein